MTTHKGKPSGAGKSEGTGVPTNLKPENLKKNEEITEKYTEEDGSISDQVKQRNPNRNRDKGNATNAHGYKN